MTVGQTNMPSSANDQTSIVNPSITTLMQRTLRISNYSNIATGQPSGYRSGIEATVAGADTLAGSYRVGVYARTQNGPGAALVGIADGVDLPTVTSYYGVVGSGPNDGTGVFGFVSGGTNGVGVAGKSDAGTAVAGTSISGKGVTGASTSGAGVSGSSSTGTGAAGSSGSGAGVTGASTSGAGVTGSSNDGAGVLASSSTGSGVSANSTSGTGVTALSTSGTAVVATAATGTALVAAAPAGLAVNAVGTGRIRQAPTAATGAPTTGTYTVGEQIRDALGDLYLCVADGSPGTWRRVTAQHPAFAGAGGSVNLLRVPIRIVDTRSNGAPVTNGGATLAPNTPLTCQITGQVINGVSVPAGATGVLGNVSIVAPATDGWAALWPTGAWPGTANINFSTSTANPAIANFFVSGLHTDGTLQLMSMSAAHAVIDFFGFTY